MATDLVSTTTAAAGALHDAAQETCLALWGVALDGQERAVRLTRAWLDESRRTAEAGRTALERLTATWQAAGAAAQELAAAQARLAGLELPDLPWFTPAAETAPETRPAAPARNSRSRAQSGTAAA